MITPFLINPEIIISDHDNSNALQVVEERIQHIIWCPANPEPYYTPTGKELRPQPVGEEAGTVTFQYYPMSAVNYVRI